MKILVTKKIEVYEEFCNICDQEIATENRKEIGQIIDGVKYIFTNTDFHVHDECVKKVVQKAFEPYLKELYPLYD